MVACVSIFWVQRAEPLPFTLFNEMVRPRPGRNVVLAKQATDRRNRTEFRAVRLKERVEEKVHVFALEGDIDFHFAPVLRAVLQSKLNTRCPALILDFSAVDFIDSRGIATVIEYLRDCAAFGGKVCLAALNPDVKPIIDIVRLELVMPIFGSVEEAVAAMKQSGQPAQ